MFNQDLATVVLTTDPKGGYPIWATPEAKYVVRVKVDRSLNPVERLHSTLVAGRKQYTTDETANKIPFDQDAAEEVVLEFFWLRGCTDEAAEKERIDRGLIRDIAAQFAYNAIDPEFATHCPNSDFWQDGNGIWMFAAFYENWNGRAIGVSEYGEGAELFEEPKMVCGVRP